MASESNPSPVRLAGLLQASKEAVNHAIAPVAVPKWFRKAGSQLRGGLASLLPSAPSRVLRAPDEIELLRVALAAIYEKNASLEAQIGDLSARLKAHVSGSRAGQSMNLTARGQILKMARAGRQPDQIAGTLGIPRGEVLLLLQLQLRSTPQRSEKTSPSFKRVGEFSR